MKFTAVRWLDACLIYDACKLDEIDESYIVVSAGVLVRETDKYVSIALDYSERHENWRHIQNIPKVLIISQKTWEWIP